MLYREVDKVFLPWNGEKLRNEHGDLIIYPTSIEHVWTDFELSTIGLVRPKVEPVPDGKVVISSEIVRDGDEVKQVDVYEDAPKPQITAQELYDLLVEQGVLKPIDQPMPVELAKP